MSFSLFMQQYLMAFLTFPNDLLSLFYYHLNSYRFMCTGWSRAAIVNIFVTMMVLWVGHQTTPSVDHAGRVEISSLYEVYLGEETASRCESLRCSERCAIIRVVPDFLHSALLNYQPATSQLPASNARRRSALPPSQIQVDYSVTIINIFCFRLFNWQDPCFASTW